MTSVLIGIKQSLREGCCEIIFRNNYPLIASFILNIFIPPRILKMKTKRKILATAYEFTKVTENAYLLRTFIIKTNFMIRILHNILTISLLKIPLQTLSASEMHFALEIVPSFFGIKRLLD